MKISTRLLFGFMAVIGIVIAFSNIVFLSVKDLTSNIDRLNEYGRQQAMAGDLRFNVAWLAMPANDYIITGKREEYLKDFKNQASIIDEKLRDIEAGEISREEKEIINEIKADYEEIKRLTEAIFNIASPIGNQRAMRLMEEMDYKYAHPASEKATRLFDVIKKKQRKVSEEAKTAERQVITVVSAGIFISIIISSVIAFVMARSVSRPLKEMAILSQKIAKGDLNVAIKVKRMDEIGILAGAFNDMAISLKSSLEKQREFYKKLQRKVQQMAVFHEAVTDIASDIEIGPLLERLAFYAAHIVKAELSAIAALHPETGEVQYFKTNIPLDEFPVKRLPKGNGLLGVVLREGVPLYLDNASSDPRAAGLPNGHLPISALTGIPLLSKSGVIGGIFAANKQGGGSFTEEDNDSLMMLGLQAVTAIENARLYNKTVELAAKDGLTGLANRRVFMEELTKEASRSERYNFIFFLLMIDIDHFKKINDTYGHSAGDEVLKSMAKIFKAQIRQTDLAARYGGEEFAIILPEANIDGAKIVGERIRKAVANSPFPINHGKEINVTVSIGASCFPAQAQSIEALIENADKALYSAKNDGRNRVTFFNEV